MKVEVNAHLINVYMDEEYEGKMEEENKEQEHIKFHKNIKKYNKK